MKKLFYTFLFTILAIVSHAAKVDTVQVFSPGMQKNIKTVLVLPDSYDKGENYPVLYLLHGYGGNHATWVKGMPSVIELADKYQMLLVCPDAGNSWYLDSPVDESVRYESFVADELIAWIDNNYKTDAVREARAVTGLSMGGHGGLYLGFRHQEVFGACGSMSGGVDIRPFPNNWNLLHLLGKMKEQPENWEQHTVINQLHLLTPGSVEIIIDCGTEDFFYEVNQRLHRELLYRNIKHDFISRPGGHNATYWDNSVQYQGLFFGNYFSKRKK